jgi:hypothetical protein
MSEKNTLTVLGVLTSAFPNAKITPETIRVYLLTLQDIPFEVLEQAALQLITTSSFFPTVAELRDVSFRILLGTRSIPSANQAWEEVQHEIHHIAAYSFTHNEANKPHFSHPFIDQVIQSIGFLQLSTFQNTAADQARFCKTYELILNRTLEELKAFPTTKQFAENFALSDNLYSFLPSTSSTLNR